ncbi:DUF1778 domain-containing protein [Allohahella marinimesophila]|uniref:Uncharacterized protein n=1 Tax=Allohahella marinimesophila TaxID=1054972 RepID=A0ABP7Q325_9GAMM
MSDATDPGQENEVMSLDQHDSEAFFEALVNPVRFNQKLMAAFEEHDQRVTSKCVTAGDQRLFLPLTSITPVRDS